jgi:dTDP-4-amino-4,6-dideoxygalactose transaminase
MNQARREIARRYVEGINNVYVEVPEIEDDSHVAHLFMIKAEERDDLRQSLLKEAIHTEVHYPLLDYHQPSFPARDRSTDPLPVSEALVNSILSLPCFWGLTWAEQESVIQSVNKWRPGEAR